MKLKVVPEPSARWMTAIGQVGQLHVRVELLDRRIVPVGDLAEVDLGERRAVEHDVARLHAVEIDDRHDAAHHHRPLRETGFVEVLGLQRRVGGAEGHGLGLDLLDAAARADRLIVEAVAGLLLIGVRPFGVDREREGRAGAGDVGSRMRTSSSTASRAAPNTNLENMDAFRRRFLRASSRPCAERLALGPRSSNRSWPRLYEGCETF